MTFNDEEWRRRSSERMRAMHSDPTFRAARAEHCRRLHRDPFYQQKRGHLTDVERVQVISEIEAGKDRHQIAADWLLTKGWIDHIASYARRGLNSKGKPVA